MVECLGIFSIYDTRLKSGQKGKDCKISLAEFNRNRRNIVRKYLAATPQERAKLLKNIDKRAKSILFNEVGKKFKGKENDYIDLFHSNKERPKCLSDEHRFQQLADLLFEKPEPKKYFPDSLLLSVIRKDPRLSHLYDNKDKLIAAVSEIYKNPPQLRTKFGDPSFRSKYPTERPSVKTLDNLTLMRLYLLNRALKRDKFKKDLGEIIFRDLNDKKTEHGGRVIYEKGKLVLDRVPAACVLSNHSYIPPSTLLIGAIMRFHAHAISNNHSKYVGPSEPDILSLGSSTGVVFTACGEGKVNIDLYFIDKKTKKPVVVDLGVHTIPFRKKLRS
ncbi:MAG: hypothetical protein HQ564_05265 [Candidatus Saganbacteria bacterium]|nr:hypothetical protein [Candidatus Saganbacteria bacterium]